MLSTLSEIFSTREHALVNRRWARGTSVRVGSKGASKRPQVHAVWVIRMTPRW